MTAYPALIAAQLGGRTVRFADMARFYFKSGEMRLHQGAGILVDGNGELWRGINRLGRMSGITAGPGGAAEEMTLALAADEEMLARFEADAEESAGQTVARYLQFFDIREWDEQGNWVEWQPLDAPMEIFRGKMGPLTIDRPPLLDPGEEFSRLLTVKAINAFVNRRRPRSGFFSQRSQQAIHPTDNLFINTSEMASAIVRWPADLV